MATGHCPRTRPGVKPLTTAKVLPDQARPYSIVQEENGAHFITGKLTKHPISYANCIAVYAFHPPAQLRARWRGCFLSTCIVCVVTLLTIPKASAVWTFTVRVGVVNPLPEVENLTALNAV